MPDVPEDKKVSEAVPEIKEEIVEQKNEVDSKEEELPLYAKERIGKLQKRYQRDMKRLQQQIAQLSNQLSMSQSVSPQMAPGMSPQSQMPAPDMAAGELPMGSDVDPQIARAVQAGWMAQEARGEQQKRAEQMAHLQRQYQSFQDEMDQAAEKYDDFDDVVRSPETPFNETMRDAALLLPNRIDVLYKLGKSPEELKRIRNLPPVEQTREMVRLSIALAQNKDAASTIMEQRHLNPMRSNPAPSSTAGITNKTSISDLRNKMRTGGMRWAR